MIIEIEVAKSNLNLKKITKITMIIIMMNILIIKEIRNKKTINKNLKITPKDKTNSINKKIILIKMMIFSNNEMKREKCLIMNKKYLIKANFKLMKIKPKKVKGLIIKTKKILCWDQQVQQLEEIHILKMIKGKELKKYKSLKIVCQQEMQTKHLFNIIIEIL